MSLNTTVTKKILETIVHETFSNFGILSSSSLLDSLKLLGFYYATNAGISINIEDLKTPDIKKEYIKKANKEIKDISEAWSEGIVSDQERFQSIIDSWNIATESLKNRIIDYYQDFDPANNLYIMAFSGARGNMSQVRQLVGMRGLMSDQEGKIIDLPIQANFREGLSSIDYIISSYGARKGIVDTALKTADSGYLTRRLIYLAQDLVIREIDCKTKKGILIELKKSTSIKNLVGRSLLSIKEANFPFLDFQNALKNEKILSFEELQLLKQQSPLLLTIRSSLTCESKGSICQKCYGWDLAHQKAIGLGETVGIIAAQSIGEPGTQLTMRTFHTGGIFTGETLKQLVAPFSGKIIIPPSLKTLFYRTNHGIEVLKLQQEAQIVLIDWKGLETKLFLEIGSYLYISKTSFVYKGQLISELLNQSIVSTERKLKPIYTRISGKVICNDIIPVYRRKKLRRRLLLKQGLLWIAAGNIFCLPNEAEYLFSKTLDSQKAISRVKIITPKQGLIFIDKSSISILTEKEKVTIQYSEFTQNIENCFVKIYPIVKNYQYVDSHTVLAFLYIFPNTNGKIIKLEEKKSKLNDVFFALTDKNNWKIYGNVSSYLISNQFLRKNERNQSLLRLFELDKLTQKTVEKNQIKNLNFSLLSKSKESVAIISPNTFKNKIISIQNSGFQIKNERYFNSFQYLDAICLPTSTILNYKENDFVGEKKLFATLVNYTQQTDDIVQGLPKIEELVEARKAKIEASLVKRPGTFLETFLGEATFFPTFKEKNTLKCLLPEINLNLKSKKSKEKKNLLVGHSFELQKNIFSYKNLFFEIHYFSPLFKFSKEDRCFKNLKKKLELSGKKYIWKKKYMPSELFFKLLVFLNKLSDFDLKKALISKNLFLSKIIYEAENNLGSKDYIIEFHPKISIYLKNVMVPFSQYSLPITSNILIKEGEFIDIGEPLNDGIIDSHELLNILFVYHSHLDGMLKGTIKSLNKFQLILSNSIQSIYQAQGVSISSKHIEIIVRQMTSKVMIKNGGDTPLLEGELIPFSFLIDICNIFEKNLSYKTPHFEPKLLSATNSSLNKDGFLSSAGFQETRRILTKAAIEGNSDWLRGLKESIMSGKIIPAGSAFLNYKNYLDNLYFFKN